MLLDIPEYVGMDPRLQNRLRPGAQHMPYSPLYPGGPTWDEIVSGDEVDKDHMVWG